MKIIPVPDPYLCHHGIKQTQMFFQPTGSGFERISWFIIPLFFRGMPQSVSVCSPFLTYPGGFSFLPRMGSASTESTKQSGSSESWIGFLWHPPAPALRLFRKQGNRRALKHPWKKSQAEFKTSSIPRNLRKTTTRAWDQSFPSLSGRQNKAKSLFFADPAERQRERREFQAAQEGASARLPWV